MASVAITKKIDSALKLLTQFTSKTNNELLYSGGKGSDVVRALSLEAGIPFHLRFNDTGVMFPGARKRAETFGAMIYEPKEDVLAYIKRFGLPKHKRRRCCDDILWRVSPDVDTYITGAYRLTSALYNQVKKVFPVRSNIANGRSVMRIAPLLDWRERDLKDFAEYKGLDLHWIYYNPDGSLNVERRVGCMGCPAMGYSYLREFYSANPGVLKSWVQALAAKDGVGIDAASAVFFKFIYFGTKSGSMKWCNMRIEDPAAFKAVRYSKVLSKLFNIDIKDYD